MKLHVNRQQQAMSFGRYRGLAVLFAFLFLLLSAADAFASNCTSQATGNWSSSGTWTNCGGSIPGTDDSVTIATGHTVTLNTNSTIQQIVVNGTLQTDNIAGSPRTLTLTQTPTGNVLFTRGANGSFIPGNSTVVMSADSDETVTSGTLVFNNLKLTPTVTSSNTYTFGAGSITVNGDFEINPSRGSGGGTRDFIVNMGASITVAGTTTVMATGTGVVAELDTRNDYGFTSGRLEIGTNGTFTANGSIVNLNGATGPLFARTGTFQENTSTVVMNSPASVALTSGNITFYRLTVAMPGQTGTLGSPITVTNALAVNSGTLSDGGNQITGDAAATMTMASGTDLVIGTAGSATTFPTLFIRANTTLNAASTVTYNAGAAQSISAIPVYGNLVLASTLVVTKTASSTLDINGSLTIGANNTLSAGTSTHTLAGNFTNNGTLNASTGTIVLDGSSNQSVGGSGTTTFNNLQLNNSSGATLNSSLTIGGTLTLTSGALSVGANTLTLNGPSVSVSSGSLATTASSNLVFGGTSSSIFIPSTASVLNNLTVNNSNGVSLLGSMTVNGTLTLTNGTFSVRANTLTLNGPAIAGTPTNLTTAISSSLVFGGSSAGISLPSSVTNLSNLTINNAQGVTLNGNLTMGGTLTLTSGTLQASGRTLALNGPAIAGTPANLATSASTSLSFGGSSTSVSIPSHIGSLTNLTVSNANGVAMNAAISVSGTLTLTSGALTTNGHALTSTGNCTSSVTRTSGYVVGSLTLTYPATSSSCTFHVGTGTSYAPIDVRKPLTLSGGTLTGGTIGAEHPFIAVSTIDATKDVNRYWTLSNDTIGASTYEVTVRFVTGDVDSGATATSFVIGHYNGSSWSMPTPVTATSTSTGSTNVTGPLINASFAVGEGQSICTVPSGMPSDMTCVCDNFGRATLNPSTIYGGNWSLSASSGSFGLPRIVNSGYLRMTDNSGNVSTAATMPGIFPAKGNLITVEFRHYAYNGTGADGIALTLSDATMAATPGAYGGSLGYAQKNSTSCATPPCNGFNGGWVGIGIDEFGNYSNPTEGRSGGAGFRPDSVAVRGSGSGLTGYPYMAGTTTLSPGIDNAGATSAALGHAYRISVDARCYEADTNNSDVTCSNPSLAKRAQVTVHRDTTGTGTFNAGNQVITFDAYQANPSQATVPDNWKLSFTSSTGGNTNIHELQGLKICAQTITPPAGYRIEVDNLTPSTCATPGGTPSSPIVTITALDNKGNTVTTYDKTINLSAALSSGSTSAATWRKVGAASNLVGNQYTFTASDNGVARFYLTDASAQSVYITASENGGTIATSLGTPVVFSGSTFSITNIDSLRLDTGGGVVAGRPHLMQVSRTNGCSTDTTFTGVKNLDGWYTPVASDHPSLALAPDICTTNASDTCLPASGTSCQTLSIAAPAIDATNNRMPALTFASGNAKFCLVTKDVGKYSVSLRDDTSTPVVGTSDTLTVRPFAIAVTDIKAGTQGNAGSTSASHTTTVLTDAGLNFQATVGGYKWNSAGDQNNDGLPDAAATRAQVTGAGVAPHFAGTVTLSAMAPYYPQTTDPEQGTLNNGNVAITTGSNTQLSLTYSEVGSFTMGASPDTSYLKSGVDLTPRVAIFASPLDSEGRNPVVGRFKPNRFALVDPVTGSKITNRSTIASCTSGFTYMGEPFKVNFRLQALNADGAMTKKYTGDYAKFSPANWLTNGANNTVGLWMVATGYPAGSETCRAIFTNGTTTTFSCTGSASLADVTRAAGTRVTIVGTPTVQKTEPDVVPGYVNLSASVALERADVAANGTPDGPYNNLKIGVNPRDEEGVGLASLNLDTDSTAGNDRYEIGSTAVRFGRLRLLNAHGSDRLNLPIPIKTEYWSGSSFITNTDDNCTSISAANVVVDGHQGGIGVANVSNANVVVGSTFAAGVGSLRLNKPACSTVCSRGSVNVCVDLGNDLTAPPTCAATSSAGMPWLQGRWSAISGQPAFDDDPHIRATFGVLRSGPVIYTREMY